ncbi:uncharacterized protein G2W53_014078 [Senna tora]|uniref:Uncharacterized protein n=1 Tax=Senna tora TaxID=362788 RepID=A0A834U2Z8_9FABA|nr:uncharacterized protein G2W53_014078 [Senna tora]
MWSTQANPSERPSMSKVLEMLEGLHYNLFRYFYSAAMSGQSSSSETVSIEEFRALYKGLGPYHRPFGEPSFANVIGGSEAVRESSVVVVTDASGSSEGVSPLLSRGRVISKGGFDGVAPRSSGGAEAASDEHAGLDTIVVETRSTLTSAHDLRNIWELFFASFEREVSTALKSRDPNGSSPRFSFDFDIVPAKPDECLRWKRLIEPLSDAPKKWKKDFFFVVPRAKSTPSWWFDSEGESFFPPKWIEPNSEIPRPKLGDCSEESLKTISALANLSSPKKLRSLLMIGEDGTSKHNITRILATTKREEARRGGHRQTCLLMGDGSVVRASSGRSTTSKGARTRRASERTSKGKEVAAYKDPKSQGPPPPRKLVINEGGEKKRAREKSPEVSSPIAKKVKTSSLSRDMLVDLAQTLPSPPSVVPPSAEKEIPLLSYDPAVDVHVGERSLAPTYLELDDYLVCKSDRSLYRSEYDAASLIRNKMSCSDDRSALEKLVHGRKNGSREKSPEVSSAIAKKVKTSSLSRDMLVDLAQTLPSPPSVVPPSAEKEIPLLSYDPAVDVHVGERSLAPTCPELDDYLVCKSDRSLYRSEYDAASLIRNKMSCSDDHFALEKLVRNHGPWALRDLLGNEMVRMCFTYAAFVETEERMKLGEREKAASALTSERDRLKLEKETTVANMEVYRTKMSGFEMEANNLEEQNKCMSERNDKVFEQNLKLTEDLAAAVAARDKLAADSKGYLDLLSQNQKEIDNLKQALEFAREDHKSAVLGAKESIDWAWNNCLDQVKLLNPDLPITFDGMDVYLSVVDGKLVSATSPKEEEAGKEIEAKEIIDVEKIDPSSPPEKSLSLAHLFEEAAKDPSVAGTYPSDQRSPSRTTPADPAVAGVDSSLPDDPTNFPIAEVDPPLAEEGPRSVEDEYFQGYDGSF